MSLREMMGPNLSDPEWMYRLWRAAEDAIREGDGECRTNDVVRIMGDVPILDVARGLRVWAHRGKLVKVQEGLSYRWRLPGSEDPGKAGAVEVT